MCNLNVIFQIIRMDRKLVLSVYLYKDNII